MGNGQSVRASHFQRPNASGDDSPATQPEVEDLPQEPEHHISISNKMVERLVEDATLAGGAAAAVAQSASSGRLPRADHRDVIYIEKLKYLDETHSEKYGLNIEDVNALAKRVEMRTEVTLQPEPVCEDYATKVMECYDSCKSPDDVLRCWESVGEFSACVNRATSQRLAARDERRLRDQERLERDMQHAREHGTLRGLNAQNVPD